MRKLPEAEFQVMQEIWSTQPPITSSVVLGHWSGEKSWPIQSVVTLLGRLVTKEFLLSEKKRQVKAILSTRFEGRISPI
jgi:predicted transcriptional regulator